MAEISKATLKSKVAEQVKEYDTQALREFVAAELGEKTAMLADVMADGANSVRMANRMIEDFGLKDLAEPYLKDGEYHTRVWSELLWPFAILLARGLTERCQAEGMSGRFKIDIASDDGSVRLVYTKAA